MNTNRQFAEIALPISVRQTFSYLVPDALIEQVQPGQRVWVPFKSRYAIGMITDLHTSEPAFKVKSIKRILDRHPVLSAPLLELINWMHRYYYCSKGEAINAALPLGLNFQTVSKLSLKQRDFQTIDLTEKEVIEILLEGDKRLDEIEKRMMLAIEPVVDRLVDNNVIVRWDEPVVKVEAATVSAWAWADGLQLDLAADTTADLTSKVKWKRALALLAGLSPPFRPDLKEKYSDISPYTLQKLVDEGYLKKIELEKNYLIEGLDYKPNNIRKLNAGQYEIFIRIKKLLMTQQYHTLLIDGITGSGKTEVYIHALKEVIEAGYGSLILVPEIALTPQTVRRFYEIFGDKIAVLHSRLNQRERLDAWNKLKRGEKQIAIGARSALFAPVQNLKLIVIDEEHDQSYRQDDPAPRYHARETAIMRAYLERAVVVLGSATPDVSTLYRSQKGLYERHQLKTRHANAVLPEVHLIDLKKYKSAMRGPIAVPLFLAITSRLEKKEQIILLYNRRGFSSFLLCENCGQMLQCPNCSVTLTYHKNSNSYRCHYCGFSKYNPRKCDKCHHPDLTQHGSGTQRIEEEIQNLFPKARLLRMDQDTTRGKNGHNTILEVFRNHQADILIGTQLVSKGLDFPNVTLVGVINADTELAFPAYNSSERMFQLLSQVSGRSGRGDKAGEVFIQTRKPDHPAVYFAVKHNYQGFSKEILTQRAALAYPPFSKLILFECKSKFYDKALTVAEELTEIIKSLNDKWPVLGPAPSNVMKVKKEYRWEVYLKINSDSKSGAIEGLLDSIMTNLSKKNLQSLNHTRINIHVDI